MALRPERVDHRLQPRQRIATVRVVTRGDDDAQIGLIRHHRDQRSTSSDTPDAWSPRPYTASSRFAADWSADCRESARSPRPGRASRRSRRGQRLKLCVGRGNQHDIRVSHALAYRVDDAGPPTEPGLRRVPRMGRTRRPAAAVDQRVHDDHGLRLFDDVRQRLVREPKDTDSARAISLGVSRSRIRSALDRFI